MTSLLGTILPETIVLPWFLSHSGKIGLSGFVRQQRSVYSASVHLDNNLEEENASSTLCAPSSSIHNPSLTNP